ncbi:MAG: hypothetical protein QNJ55_24270 [Xenococcus sp. MO_188.B8]|nr:hypothetical protein [Xenococcus sp. MO_188.B8]
MSRPSILGVSPWHQPKIVVSRDRLLSNYPLHYLTTWNDYTRCNTQDSLS